MTLTTTEAPVQEAQTEVQTTTKSKAKVEKTGNLILDIAHEVEGLTKTKALNLADTLVSAVETDNFKLGGVLKLIHDNSWFEGYANFDAFVQNRYGFQVRKAHYLMEIYENLVTKQIPWEKVQHLGWTKLKDLAKVLTLENVDEWVEKATPLTVLELQALLRGNVTEGGEQTAKTTDEIVTFKVKLKNDQNETVTQALAKAKGELHTEFDSVALEGICAGYLGGNSEISKAFDLDAVIQSTGFEAVLQRVSELFPQYDINVAPAEVKK